MAPTGSEASRQRRAASSGEGSRARGRYDGLDCRHFGRQRDLANPLPSLVWIWPFNWEDRLPAWQALRGGCRLVSGGDHRHVLCSFAGGHGCKRSVFARLRRRNNGLAAVNSACDVYSTLVHPATTPQSIVETMRLRFRPEKPIAYHTHFRECAAPAALEVTKNLKPGFRN